jgi:exodeoxyribonuclease-3
VKIICWNVNGIRAVYKKGLLEFVQTQDPDIFCIQETKAHIEQVEEAAKKLGMSHSYWSSAVRKGYSGTATFVKEEPKKASTSIGLLDYESEGRIVMTDHGKFELYNIYFPNGGSGEARHDFKQNFLKDLNAYLKPRLDAGKHIVVLGDYNVAHKEIDVHDPKRLSKESGFLPEERAWFDSFLALGFIDTFRHFHPDEKDRYSWWSYRELAKISNRGWRIDYICVSQNMQKNLVAAEIMDHIEGSDHCPITLELKF